MKKYLIIGIILALLVVSGCTGNGDDEQQVEEIKIGVLVPLTGGLGTYGEAMANGAKLAVAQISEEGINGQSVRLIIEDTGTDPAKAAEAARKLIDVDNVQVIIGASGSTQTLAVAPVAEKSKVVMISPASTAPSVSDAGEYIFRVVGSDNLQGEAIARLAQEKGYTKAATLAENNDYGIGLETVFKEHFEGSNATTTSTHYEKGKGDYRTELEIIKQDAPEVIIFIGYPAEASTILLQARDLGLEVDWIAADGLADPKMFENADVATEMESMLLTKPSSPQDDPAYLDFISKHKEAFGTEPGIYADTHYDATTLAILAIAEAGNDGEKIKDALAGVSTTYEAVTGDKSFDENGDVAQDYVIFEVQNGSMTTIGSWSKGSGVALE